MELELEHCLLSLSKWEEEFEKPFLGPDEKSQEEVMGYVYHMIFTPGVSRQDLSRLTRDDFLKVNQHIEGAHSATTFGEMPEKKSRGEIITSELIYYWMVAFNIPFECERWHLNRLFALVRICNLKNQPEKKMSKHEIAQRNRMLNEQRKAKLGTSG
jgi:hypothetical protein